MRLYGKKFMANRTEARIQDRRESRDAVVYDITESLRYCRVTIAGSTTLVRAWFPANFMRAPQWLKVATAVRVAHVGGDKSRIEVIGPGLIQPTQSRSILQGGGDSILLGMNMAAAGTGYAVQITPGTYRINGVNYLFNASAPDMDNAGWHMGDGGDMSGSYYLATLDPMDNMDGLWFRYDAFVIGNDGVVDYLKGAEYEWVSGGTGPIRPSVTSNHILLQGYILLWSGTSGITNTNIGQEFEVPHPESMVVEYSWAEKPVWAAEELEIVRAFGVVFGGPRCYEGGPPQDTNPDIGSQPSDMSASCTVAVMTQYGTPFTYFTNGSLNFLDVKSIGSEGVGSLYGEASVGLLPATPIPLPGPSGEGEPVHVNLGLGYQLIMDYVRSHDTVIVESHHADGYPEYRVAKPESTTGLYMVTLVSPDAVHPVTTMVTFFNLTMAGQPC